jgi:outer membrane protein assembly factor BamB
VYEWEEREMLQIPIEFGQGMIPVALSPVQLSQMEKYIYCAIRGEVHCIDPKTGKSEWEDAFPRASSSYYGSPTIAGNILYAPREDGVILIADIAKGFKFLGEYNMEERVIASPVPVNNQIIIRGEKNLLLFGS